MDERDDNLARLYRHAAREEPPAHVDLAVMERARRALRRRVRSPFGGHWLAGGAVAAVALLSVVLVVLMQGQPELTVSEDAAAPVAADGRIRLTLPPAGARREAEPGAGESGPAAAKRARTEAEADVAGRAAAGAPADNAAAPAGEPGPPPPRFDFYRTLPEMQVEAPPPVEEPVAPSRAGPAVTPAAPAAPVDPESAPMAEVSRAASETAPAAAVTDSPVPADTRAATSPIRPATGYYLQVGAFRAADYADRLRERLVRLRHPASVEAIELANGEVWHRVRVGPYADPDTAEAVQTRLRAEGIDSLLVRPGEGAAATRP